MIKYPEKVPQKIANSLNDLEIRIMEDIVRRIQKAGTATASTNWQITRLKELGASEKYIQSVIKETLGLTDKQLKEVFESEASKQYKDSGQLYKATGNRQIPFDENRILQKSIDAVKMQTQDTLQNITRSMGFVKKTNGQLSAEQLTTYYRKTLDNAIYDIQSGAFDYSTVLNRTINEMAASGVRWIDFGNRTHNRIDVAARRAVMTGFRQLQAQISEQTAAELGTDHYEVSMHGGARPEHQEWQGKVYTKDELYSVCGLGEPLGLCGINCYHSYWPFVPGVSTRTYTDEQIKAFNEEENRPREYGGKKYTKYEALQEQRRMETQIRAIKERIHLKELAGVDEQLIINDKAKYQTLMQRYKAFSSGVGLPVQRDRLNQGDIKIKVTPIPVKTAATPVPVPAKAPDPIVQAEHIAEVHKTVGAPADEYLENAVEIEEVAKAEEEHTIAEGKRIIDTFERRKDEFEFDIEDTINAQGFDGLPRVVDPEEFDKYVEESGFIAQRNYSAPNKEILDAYREELYNGKWYVDCSAGGAQYGQGMYCAADYTGNLSEGIKKEMEHYEALGHQRNSFEAFKEHLKDVKLKDIDMRYKMTEEQFEVMKKYMSTDVHYQSPYALSEEDRKIFNEIKPKAKQEARSALIDIRLDVEKNYVNNSYTETLTLDPSAKIFVLPEGRDSEDIGNILASEYAKSKLPEEYHVLLELHDSVTEIINEQINSSGTVDRDFLDRLYEQRKAIREHEDFQKHIAPLFSEFFDKLGNMNDASAAVLMGYDAINAKGHGASGSYTVILNRTKVIFRRGG